MGRTADRTERRRVRRRSNAGLYLALILLFLYAFITTALLATNLRDSKSNQRVITTPPLTTTYTYDGEPIRYYTMVDPDSNVQYLVNDRGGMIRRYNE